MTKQAKSDEEVSVISRKEMTEYADMGHFSNPDVALPYLIDGHDLGYKRCEKELLPIINQQSEEIEKLKAESADRLHAYMKEVENRETLQSRFDELVKSLDAISGQLYFDIPTGTVDAFELIQLLKKHYDGLESLITKAKGQANG